MLESKSSNKIKKMYTILKAIQVISFPGNVRGKVVGRWVHETIYLQNWYGGGRIGNTRCAELKGKGEQVGGGNDAFLIRFSSPGRQARGLVSLGRRSEIRFRV